MINEQRVKEMYHMALFDESEGKRCRKIVQYYRSDYISKEMIVSFFTGTLAFLLCLLLYAAYDTEKLLELINIEDYFAFGLSVLWKYALFLACYLMITYIVAHVRYQHGQDKLEKYHVHLKRVNSLYEADRSRK